MTPVSVVIIAHRNHDTLPKTLRCVELYSRPGDEKILVLNNPSDEVKAIANSLDKSWIIGYETKPGPQHARNKGTEISSHKYLAFFDDDVQLTQGWIDEMLKHFSSPWVAAGQSYIKFEKHDSLYWNYQRFANLAHLYQFLNPRVLWPTMDTAAVMIKKSWLESLGGFHPDLSYVEDTEFSVRIYLNRGKIFFTTKAEVIQTYHPGETFLDALKKTVKFAPNLMEYKRLLKQKNAIELSPLKENLKFRKKLYLRNFSFFAFDVLKFVLRELASTKYRHLLIPSHSENSRK